jgi:4'-phosphopantetheinyl transferase EntD
MNLTDSQLQAAIDALSVPGVVINHRIISPGDEHALLPEESDSFARSVVKVKRASGAARIVARELLFRLGHEQWALPKSSSGAPVWPGSIVGSLAHDMCIAVAAIGLSRDIAALGIDIEPAEMLPFDLSDWITTPQERQNICADVYGGKILFAAKEAVYKAVYPLDHAFFDYQDIEIDLVAGKAVVCNGRVLNLRICMSSHIIAVAFIPNRVTRDPPAALRRVCDVRPGA